MYIIMYSKTNNSIISNVRHKKIEQDLTKSLIPKKNPEEIIRDLSMSALPSLIPFPLSTGVSLIQSIYF